MKSGYIYPSQGFLGISHCLNKGAGETWLRDCLDNVYAVSLGLLEVAGNENNKIKDKIKTNLANKTSQVNKINTQ